MSIDRHRQDGRAGQPGNEAAPIGKPEVGAIALTGHGHDLLFGRPSILRKNYSGIITDQIAEANVGNLGFG